MDGHLTPKSIIAAITLLLTASLFCGCIHYERRPEETTGNPGVSTPISTEQLTADSEPVTEPPSSTESPTSESFSTAVPTDENGFPNGTEDDATKRY
ncbi:MAG: hypothetical protein E7637_04160 [Ruminococcaceae bacterium]|nr:hypothetical protein [Oscillospiraceae bacterium]